MKQTISVTVNGETRTVEVAASEILLAVLRDKLGITSAKPGCGHGECGACTVMLDGKSVRPCLILAIEVADCEITTVEGIGAEGPSPLQQALMDHDAFQCGYCAPGVVVAATELLDTTPRPSKSQIAAALAGNLCRCTGYRSIIDAVYAASIAPKSKAEESR